MKKWIALVLCITVLSVFSACGKEAATGQDPSASSRDQTSKIQTVEENASTVQVTIPGFLFSEDDPPTKKLSDEQKEKGFIKAKINDDGSVTYSIQKDKYNDLVEEIKEAIGENLDELKKEFSFLRKTEYDADYSNVTFFVDEAAYTKSLDTINLTYSYYEVLYCRAFYAEDLSTTFTVRNADTKSVLNITVLPDDLDQNMLSDQD